MKISEFIDPRGIKLQEAIASQDEAIDKLIALHNEVGNLSDVAGFKEAILAREAKGTTAIGNGIAVPHGKSAAVKKAGLVAITCPAGVDYKALDGKPSNLLFMIAAPEGGADTHLEVLSKLMQMLMDPAFCKTLVESKSVDEFLAHIDAKEAEKDAANANKTDLSKAASGTKKIVAVTACPTGIAHTFMAAESLEQKAKELGIAFRVEKDGSGGAKDPLTAKEIEEADAVITKANAEIDVLESMKDTTDKVTQSIINKKIEEKRQSAEVAKEGLSKKEITRLRKITKAKKNIDNINESIEKLQKLLADVGDDAEVKVRIELLEEKLKQLL